MTVSLAVPGVGVAIVLARRSGPGPAAPPGVTRVERAQEGEPAPDFTLTGVDGRRVTLSRLRGRPVVLAFFASWCHPCEEELPVLEQVQREHARDLAVVGVNFKDDKGDSADFVHRLHVTFPALLEDVVDNPVAGRYDVRWVPQTFFIDADGVVRRRIFGQTSRRALQPALDALLPRR